MKILIIDNYDSFTYNLYQYCGEIMPGSRIDVVRNDQITIKEIKKRRYDRIILSPGPGNPEEKKYFGVCSDIILDVGRKIPVLGVCLGMQGIAYFFGGKIIKAMLPMHGKVSSITHNEKGLFRGLPQDIEGMRYHSLVVDPSTLPECLEITAVVGDSLEGHSVRDQILKNLSLTASQQQISAGKIEIMGLRHKEYPIEGIQFHPESFATDGGKIILRNFLFQKI